MKKRGFTLIELLVVITIISILAAILFPVFSRAREKGRQASCTSNIKQLSLAWLMYQQDYDGMYPINRIDEATLPGGHATWRYVVQPYIRNEQIYECPSKPGLKGEMDYEGYPADIQDIRSNYACNGNIFGEARSDSAITRPSELIMLLETRDYWPDLGTWTISWNYGDGGGAIGFWHNGTGNYGFADGHVKVLKLSQTLQYQDNFMWDWWTTDAEIDTLRTQIQPAYE